MYRKREKSVEKKGGIKHFRFIILVISERLKFTEISQFIIMHVSIIIIAIVIYSVIQ